MADTQDGTVTPQKVQELATQQIILPRVALIGVFGSTGAPGALIRNPDGSINRVTVGDRAAGGIVAAIADAKIIIAMRGTSIELELPSS